MLGPIYIKNMQSLVPFGTPPSTPPSRREPSPEPRREEEEEKEEEHVPMLLSYAGFVEVYPKEATRDVMSGKVGFNLIDQDGVTRFNKKHIFCALKLDDEKVERFQDYRCIGGHERRLKQYPERWQGLGWRGDYGYKEVDKDETVQMAEARWVKIRSFRKSILRRVYGHWHDMNNKRPIE